MLTATTLDDYTDGTEVNTTPDELAMPEEGVNTEERTVLDTDETGKNADTSDEYLYADDFEYKEEAEGYLESRGNEPRYMIDTHGAWVVEDGQLAQILTASVNQWNGGDPMTIVGDFRWMNYIADVDITVPADNDGAWAGLGIRTQGGMNWNQDGYTLRIYGSGNLEKMTTAIFAHEIDFMICTPEVMEYYAEKDALEQTGRGEAQENAESAGDDAGAGAVSGYGIDITAAHLSDSGEKVMFCIFKNSEHKEEALKFAESLMQASDMEG